MFWFVKKRQQNSQENLTPPVQSMVEKKIDFTVEIDDEEERDCVSVIASAIMANNNPNTSFKVKSVRRIDVEMEHCAVIASAIMAANSLESSFKLVSIERI